MIISLKTFNILRNSVIPSVGWKYFATITREPKLLALNDLHNIPNAKPKRIRWGRGTGSGRGKLCGWGHQKSRSTPRGFEGGQTPLYRRLPKIGFHNINQRDLQYVNLNQIQQFIDMGRLHVKPKEMVTMRDLIEAGLFSQAKEGVKLLAKGKSTFRSPIHLEVSFASMDAIKTVEAAGGTVTCVHFNRLALRALIKPYKFNLLPNRARPPPRIKDYYLDKNKSGYLSPEIQIRNLKLFGSITSEKKLREDHEHFLNYKRAELRKKRELILGSPEVLAKLTAKYTKQ